MDKYELITPEIAEGLKRENKEVAKRAAISNALIAFQAKGFALAAEAGYEAALEWVESPQLRKELVEAGISAEQQQSFVNILRSSVKAEETKEKLLQEQNDNIISDEFLGLLTNKLDLKSMTRLTTEPLPTNWIQWLEKVSVRLHRSG